MDGFTFRTANEDDIDSLVAFETAIEAGLPNREMFAIDGREFYEPLVGGQGRILLAMDSQGELAGVNVLRFPPADDPENLGLNLGLPEAKLAQVLHLESAFIRPDCRGRNLARILTDINLEGARDHGRTIRTATAWPGNAPSLATLTKMGLGIRAFAYKYGGRPRFVLSDWGPRADTSAAPLLIEAFDFEGHCHALGQGFIGTRVLPREEASLLTPADAPFPPFNIAYLPPEHLS